MPKATPAAPEVAAEPHVTGDLDLAVLVGTLSSDPVVQDLPSGSRLVRYEVTIRDRSPADSVPVSLLDPGRPSKLAQGDRVVVVGRVRRRFFRAGGATRSATEVVAASVRRTRSTSAAANALLAALEVLDEL
jgi:single-strand DNA-binding protein